MKGDYCIWQSVFYSFIYLYTYTLYLYLKAICKGQPLPESGSRYYSTWQFSGQYYKKNFFLVCKSTIPFPPNQERQYLFSRDFLLPFLMYVITTILSFYLCVTPVFNHICHFVWVIFPSIKWLLVYTPQGHENLS